eukprot:Nitzschia sp. Nitz4//scaffold28_size193895//173813//174352//NITZ4_001688-RA/size193895-augustus-gene-0.298-mRNA-1//1//CDS//3329546051//4648//frame0
MSAARARVLAGYKRLNRARIQLFQGDSHAMAVTYQQMRAEFERNKNIVPAGPEFEAMVAGIDEAADMLIHEIIRGDLNEDTGRYEMKIKREHVQGSAEGEIQPEVELITEDTVERMENPSKIQVCKSSSAKKD